MLLSSNTVRLFAKKLWAKWLIQVFMRLSSRKTLKPVGQPKIESVVDNAGQDLEYTATFEVYPEVKLADLSKVSISRPVADINSDDLDKMIDVLRNQQASFDETDKPAADGDKVNIDFVGTLRGKKNFPVVLQKHRILF